MKGAAVFGALKYGAYFISAPHPGDAGPAFVFRKIDCAAGAQNNARRLFDGLLTTDPESMPVVEVLL